MIVYHYEYDSFGNELTGVTGNNSFQFSTKYYDEEIQLSYYGFRYYESVSGRWLNRDPIGEFGGINLYLGMKNSLIQIIDSDGRLITHNPNDNKICFATVRVLIDFIQDPAYSSGCGGGAVGGTGFAAALKSQGEKSIIDRARRLAISDAINKATPPPQCCIFGSPQTQSVDFYCEQIPSNPPLT